MEVAEARGAHRDEAEPGAHREGAGGALPADPGRRRREGGEVQRDPAEDRVLPPAGPAHPGLPEVTGPRPAGPACRYFGVFLGHFR